MKYWNVDKFKQENVQPYQLTLGRNRQMQSESDPKKKIPNAYK